MRKLTIVSLAALSFIGTALAANFLLTKSAETSSTITFTYPAQAGADGYRYYAPGSISGQACEGTAVSRSFNPAKTQIKFTKVASGKYCVEAIVLTPIGAAQYPITVPPPPTVECNDGIDNADPEDMLIDLADPGCTSATDTDETNPAPPPTGNVFVAPTGSDTNACTQASPCKSLQRGGTVAQAGQVVQIASGSYPEQTLFGIHKAISFIANGSVVLAGQLRVECTTGVTIDGVIQNGISSKNLLIARGNKALTIKHTTHGGGSYSAGNEDDPIVIGNVSNGSSCANPSTSDGVVIDGCRVHDYFWNTNPGSAHVDGLQFFGGSNAVTIRNCLFERIAESFIGAYPDFGAITNTIIEDTTFRDLDDCAGNSKGAQCTYFASQWGCVNHDYASQSTGFTIRRTTWSPGVWVSLRSDCRNFLVENNTFQTGPQQFACDQWNSNWGGTVTWRNNTFLNGNSCTTP